MVVVRKGCNNNSRWNVSEMQLVGLEDGWSGPPAKKCRLLLEAGKDKDTEIPLELPEGNSP